MLEKRLIPETYKKRAKQLLGSKDNRPLMVSVCLGSLIVAIMTGSPKLTLLTGGSGLAASLLDYALKRKREKKEVEALAMMFYYDSKMEYFAREMKESNYNLIDLVGKYYEKYKRLPAGCPNWVIEEVKDLF